ncbi:FecR domain-containing protein [Synechococcus sp. RedBA-s]|uniref:FecR domain-containing protein n=1 Tax=Synechococcus sp. RedBA-s TaxID=2823741 RepID=UPI0020CBF0AF|nr:FecR domain-containing protein [Synechococcus sp. RedBA-s]MCP9800302.1 FecR domain-containing protein [Synechococcus sp. RedBA-s]
MPKPSVRHSASRAADVPALALQALTVALVMAQALAAPLPALAGESAVVSEILDGNELYIDTRQARVKQKASAPQEISTRNSRGQLSFDSGAAGRLNRFSQIRLGSSCFLLSKGQVLVSGKQSGCTASSRLSVRGTNYVLEVGDDGASDLSVLEGSVEVEPLRDGVPSGEPPTTVQAGERLRLSPAGVVIALLKLTSGDYDSILRGELFRDFSTPLPAFGSLESYIRSSVPGVSIPSLPAPSRPSIPTFGLPRFF